MQAKQSVPKFRTEQRDRKRTSAAKSQTIARRQQRRAKRTIQGR